MGADGLRYNSDSYSAFATGKTAVLEKTEALQMHEEGGGSEAYMTQPARGPSVNQQLAIYPETHPFISTSSSGCLKRTHLEHGFIAITPQSKNVLNDAPVPCQRSWETQSQSTARCTRSVTHQAIDYAQISEFATK